ncbi:MAG: hypothetical protein ACRDS9_07785 [Pseudonocardiaceae bacterium]
MMFEPAFWATEAVGITAGVGVIGWIIRQARGAVITDRVGAGQSVAAAGSASYAPQKIQPEPENGGWINGHEVKPWEQDMGFWAHWDHPGSEDGNPDELAQVIPFPGASGGDQGGAA